MAERVKVITSAAAFQTELAAAGDRLVVLEVVDPDTLDATAEAAGAGWQEQARDAAAAAAARSDTIKHTFARTARDCPDSVFLELDVGSNSADLASLGVSQLPTVQFYVGGRKVWEHAGWAGLEADLGEGVLFYGDAGAGGARPSSIVAEITDRPGLDAWLASRAPAELAILDVSTSSAAACVKIFPAVLALARNFAPGNFASFARLMADGPTFGAGALTTDLGVTQAPTFVMFRGGVEVARQVGPSRGDLIAKILSTQAAAGVKPPPPPVKERERIPRSGRVKPKVSL